MVFASEEDAKAKAIVVSSLLTSIVFSSFLSSLLVFCSEKEVDANVVPFGAESRLSSLEIANAVGPWFPRSL